MELQMAPLDLLRECWDLNCAAHGCTPRPLNHWALSSVQGRDLQDGVGVCEALLLNYRPNFPLFYFPLQFVLKNSHLGIHFHKLCSPQLQKGWVWVKRWAVPVRYISPFLLERVSVFAHWLPGDEWVLAEISSVFVNYSLKKEVLLLILIISSIHF